MGPGERDADDDEYLDEDLDDGAGDAEEDDDLFAPPGDDEYQRIKFYKGLEHLPKAFLPFRDLNRELLLRPRSAFAVRFGGGDEKTGAYEPQSFTKRVMTAAQLNRWVTTTQFSGAQFPGVLATLPGSLIAHFAVPEGEAQMRLARHRDYPSVYGARAVTRLLAYAGDDDALLGAIRPLKKRGVQALLKALDDVAESDLTLNWLTHDGQYSFVGPKRARRSVETLNVVPRMIVRPPVTVVGRLNKPDHENREVRLQPVEGRPLVLRYESLELEDQIGASWKKWIVGQMVVEEPEHPNLPRAPRRRRTLVRIEQAFDELEQIPKWLTPE